jgi:hypothetical protein
MTRTAKSEQDPPAPGRERRFVTEQELLESLNRSLWEVERERVQESRNGRNGR